MARFRNPTRFPPVSNDPKFSVVGDNHGDQLDPVAGDAFFRWVATYKPQLRIHAGDAFDFRPIRGKASEKERAESMKGDFNEGMKFLKRYFSGGDEKIFLRGNHDQRLWRIAKESTGLLRDYAEDLVENIESKLREWKVTMLPYDARLGVFRRGHLQVIHGFKTGVGSAAAHARVYHNVIFGHTHTQDIVPVENIDGPALAMGTGCLCYIDMPYNETQTNKLRHQQGWVMGRLFEDGTYQAVQAKRVGDLFHVPTNLESF